MLEIGLPKPPSKGSGFAVALFYKCLKIADLGKMLR